MNPNSEIDRGRLSKAMEWSYRQLEPHRTLTHRLVEEYAGSGYGNAARRPKFEILMNLMNQTVDAYTMSLVADRPRVLVRTEQPRLRFFAKKFGIALNNLLAEIQFEYTMRQAVLDAFFCMGIVKVHMADSAQVQIEVDRWADPGTPFASGVSIDNWVHDMSVSKPSRMQYAGDWYRIPFADLEGDVFDQEEIRKSDLRPTSKWAASAQDDRLERISRAEETDQDELEPMIDLADVWIPRDGMIYTFPLDPRKPFAVSGPPIAAMTWDGPENGPYHILSFNDVPENIVPSSPASHLAGLARIINNIMRKQARKAHGQKDVFWHTAAGAQDAERLLNAADQQDVAINSPGEFGVEKMGGADPQLQALLLGLVQIYDRMAGNLTAMAGLGNQAPTLGQEEMIQGSVSKKQAAMQYRTVDFALGIIRDLGYLLWHDQAKAIPASITPQGLEDYEPIDATWRPEEREGEFYDYIFDIDQFSMPYQPPARKFATMLTLLQNVFIPGAPLMAQKGDSINFTKIAESAGEMLNLPQFEEFLDHGAMPPPPEEEGMGESPGMSPETTRNYVRHSVAGAGGTEGRSVTEQQGWLSQPEQNQEMPTVAEGA